jgi:hypothetical protein
MVTVLSNHAIGRWFSRRMDDGSHGALHRDLSALAAAAPALIAATCESEESALGPRPRAAAIGWARSTPTGSACIATSDRFSSGLAIILRSRPPLLPPDGSRWVSSWRCRQKCGDGCFVMDERGRLVPSPGQRARQPSEATVDRIAAAALSTLEADHVAGREWPVSDVDDRSPSASASAS